MVDSFLWAFLYEKAQILGFFFPRKKLHINIDKNGFGYILGDISINSSGHSAAIYL
jgi:hypothetical protein